MNKSETNIPDSTAVRVALWRALHLIIDSSPHLFKDEIGIKLVNPNDGWQSRPDMHPQGTAPFRASIIARAKFIEDLVEAEIKNGITQYVILGSGLDTFSQRRSDLISKISLYEVEKNDTIIWKRNRLKELNLPIPKSLHFVGVNFETDSWWDKLKASGFNDEAPTLITSIGVSMYLTKDSIIETLRKIKTLSSNSIFVMTFMLPLNLVDPKDRQGYEMSIRGAERSGTPFISFFSPEEMISIAKDIGFKKIKHLSTSSLFPEYFNNRIDNLKPSTGEELLILTT